MAENEKVLEPQNTPETQPSKGKNFKANTKEWFRKKAVGLKRAPQNIALVILAITTIYFMLILFTMSMALNECEQMKDYVPVAGLCVFITTLLSLLVLVSFLNAFPKRKKPNIFFIVLVFVMIAAMIGCDVGYYVQMENCIAAVTSESMTVVMKAAQPYVIGHVVLLGVSALVFALLPLYKKLILKINTKVELESATENMHGEIDIEED